MRFVSFTLPIQEKTREFVNDESAAACQQTQ
jgi:hypothetical protein